MGWRSYRGSGVLILYEYGPRHVLMWHQRFGFWWHREQTAHVLLTQDQEAMLGNFVQLVGALQ